MSYTSKEAAKLLNAGVSTVTKHARRLNLTREGRDWLLDRVDLERLAASMEKAKPGRPRR